MKWVLSILGPNSSFIVKGYRVQRGGGRIGERTSLRNSQVRKGETVTDWEVISGEEKSVHSGI